MNFKMHKIMLFFPEKKVCLFYLKFADQLPETHLFFIWPKCQNLVCCPIYAFRLLATQLFPCPSTRGRMGDICKVCIVTL